MKALSNVQTAQAACFRAICSEEYNSMAPSLPARLIGLSSRRGSAIRMGAHGIRQHAQRSAAAVTSRSAPRSSCWAGAFGPTSVVSAFVASVDGGDGAARLLQRRLHAGNVLSTFFIVWSSVSRALFRSAPDRFERQPVELR